MSLSNVRVICRFRPLNERELSNTKHDKINVIFPDNVTVNFKGKESRVFTFDRIFSPSASQEEIFHITAKDTIKDVLEGYNGTIFAYGQTGSGKTYTMFGLEGSDQIQDQGIIPRSCASIFEEIKHLQERAKITVTCSFLEIYKEELKDLLNPTNTSKLKVRETSSKGVWVEGLTKTEVTSEKDIMKLIRLGEQSRKIASTQMNQVSSRSHTLFIITLTQFMTNGITKVGSLNLADLAGSERVGKTGASGETLEEAKKINQSLSALGNCIMALTKSKRGHVPYRDSKLTFILRESLGGNSKTTLFIACSPHPSNDEETLSTLRFGNRAKSIKNNVKINQHRSIEELELIVSKQNSEIAKMRRYINELEKELKKDGKSDDQPSFRRRTRSDARENKPSKPSNSSDKDSDSEIDSLGLMDLIDAQIAFDQEREALSFQIQDLQEELAQYEHIKIDREKFRLECDAMTEELGTYKETIASLRNEVTTKEATILSQNETIVRFKELYNKHQIDESKHSEAFASLQIDYRDKQKQHEETLKILESTSQSLSIANDKITDMTEKLSHTDHQIVKLSSESMHWKLTAEKLETDLLNSTDTIKSLEDKIKEIQLSQLDASQERVLSKMDELQNVLDTRLKKQFEDYIQNEKMLSKAESTIANYEKMIEKQNQELNEYQKAKISLEESLNRQKEHYVTFVETFELNQKRMITQIEESNDRLICQLEAKVQTFENELKQVRQRELLLESQKKDFEEQISKYQVIHQQDSITIASHNAVKEYLENKIQSMQLIVEENNSLKQRMSSLEQEINEKRALEVSQAETMRLLQTEINDSKHEIEQLHKAQEELMALIPKNSKTPQRQAPSLLDMTMFQSPMRLGMKNSVIKPSLSISPGLKAMTTMPIKIQEEEPSFSLIEGFLTLTMNGNDKTSWCFIESDVLHCMEVDKTTAIISLPLHECQLFVAKDEMKPDASIVIIHEWF